MAKKGTKKRSWKTKIETAPEEELSERTVVTSIEKVSIPVDEKAYILFISGPLIGKMYLLEDEVTIIGRAPDIDISISDSRISRRHLEISLREGRAVIKDLDSTNGTFVNGKRVATKVLENGDKIHISSDTFFKFALGDAAERMFQEEMHQMANYDAVTNVLNKHAFLRRLKEEFSYSKRQKLPLSLIMIDIDFFKKVNDTYGHMAGDYVLHGVAERIQKGLRDEDIVSRYGGEEFAVILRNTDAKSALMLGERIRRSVEEKPFQFEKDSISVTVSLGISTLADGNFTTSSDLLARSDACLYKSKQDGRNRVTS
ncbi:MAG TPA: GGDEF domain-containing protein [bacterium]|nr:GGDEF domain-containing protein [Myxococcales bacterium]OQA58976.1 MAG: Response regulator PleD [bacterium ADurb.Bin270]HPW45236.1 GGDEF domain-containing protein [bacterium]HQC50292.1 GGDEF domain-containing protein [bacterium]